MFSLTGHSKPLKSGIYIFQACSNKAKQHFRLEHLQIAVINIKTMFTGYGTVF